MRQNKTNAPAASVFLLGASPSLFFYSPTPTTSTNNSKKKKKKKNKKKKKKKKKKWCDVFLGECVSSSNLV